MMPASSRDHEKGLHALRPRERVSAVAGGRLSSSAGGYLRAAWELAGDGMASTKQVADRLGVRPASVTNMLGRLREMGLVEHERYRGASLTRRGHGRTA